MERKELEFLNFDEIKKLKIIKVREDAPLKFTGDIIYFCKYPVHGLVEEDEILDQMILEVIKDWFPSAMQWGNYDLLFRDELKSILSRYERAITKPITLNFFPKVKRDEMEGRVFRRGSFSALYQVVDLKLFMPEDDPRLIQIPKDFFGHFELNVMDQLEKLLPLIQRVDNGK